jgi:hypothetical protein
MLFKADAKGISIEELHHYINETLEKNYTVEQVIIGLDYAGFKREDDKYFLKLNEKHTESK